MAKDTNNALIRYTQGDLRQAYRDVIRKEHMLELEVVEKAERLTNVNIAGYMLLRDCLDELAPREAKFAADMYAHKYCGVSFKQARWLSKLMLTYLNVEVAFE